MEFGVFFVLTTVAEEGVSSTGVEQPSKVVSWVATAVSYFVIVYLKSF